jgi:GH25 family lysozyme M1 (1,4-beta-N-acetylmuramidase)
MKRGIDVSVYQGDINWAQVKADGIDFAFIKATQGRSVSNSSLRNFTDSKFAQNIVNANRWGIRIGVYHYLTAWNVSEAMQEAEYFLSVIAPYRSIIDLWAAVDVEDSRSPQDKTLMSQIVNTFCSRVEAEGYKPMVYTNPDWLKNKLGNVSHWDLWLALWRNKANVPNAEKYPNLRVWQWGTEAVDGIAGKPDANYMISDIEVEEPPKPEPEAKPAVSSKDNTASAWAADAVKWCVDNKILLGDEKGDLMLHQPLTREQACLMAQRLYNLILEDATTHVAKKFWEALR